jgi:hypothetical protein
MSYAEVNFKHKKQLKQAVQDGARLRTFNPSGMFPVKLNGSDVIEGPWYPEPHRWYASVLVQDGVIVKVKS